MKLKNYLLLALLLLGVKVSAQNSSFCDVANKLALADKQGEVANYNLSSEQAAILAEVAPDDPEVGFEYIWPDMPDVLNRWSIEISQTVPDFRKRRAAGKVVSALNTQKFNEFKAAKAEALYQAQIKLIELIGAKKRCDLMSSLHENFDSLSVSYQRAWRHGEVTILDLNKIKIEHARADAANIEANGAYNALIQEIIALSNGTITTKELSELTEYPVYENQSELFGKINEAASAPKRIRAVDENFIFPGCLPEPENLSNGCYEDAELLELLSHSPQYLAMESKLKSAKLKVDYASKSRFPQLSLGYKHTYEDGMHFNSLLAGMTLPVWSRKQEKLAAEGEMLATQAENSQALTELVASVKSDLGKAASLKRQIDALGPIVEQTNNVKLLQMALDGGEISLLDYLQEIGYFVDAISEYNDAHLAFTLTVASLVRYF